MRRSSVLSDPQSIAAFNSGINQLRNASKVINLISISNYIDNVQLNKGIAIKNTNNMLV